jgi:hypothetical protein
MERRTLRGRCYHRANLEGHAEDKVSNGSEDQFAPLLAAAERLLSREFGREVRLGDAARLSEHGRRNLLVRSRDLCGGFPASFIIKKVVVDTYNPDDATSWDIRRFFSDWVGAQFLSVMPDGPHSPRFYGGDYSLGLFILEDLGYHRSLVEPLLKEDAASAERALLRFSGRLGALHATTVGHSAKFERLFTAISPGVWVRAQDVPNVGERVKQLQACLDRVGVHANTDETREWEAVINVTDNPGPFLSYIHGDPCPDNVFLIDDELRLIDFEFGRFGHALMDGTYGRMAFPTCWCANRLPHGLVSKMEAVYRTELAKGCSDAQEDRIFERAVVEACGFWLFNTLGRHLDGALEADHTWGIATMRQRLLARLEAFVDVAEDVDQLPGLRGTASRVLEELAKRWPGTDPLPLYPAFRDALCDQGKQ